jgi:hypothetical protein
MWMNPKNLKVSGFPSPRRARLCAAWRPNSTRLRIERQRELLQPLAHRIPKAPGVSLVLKTNDDVVGIAHNDHVTRGLTPSPAFGPEID